MTFPTHLFTLQNTSNQTRATAGPEASRERESVGFGDSVRIRSHSIQDAITRAKQLGLANHIVTSARLLADQERLERVCDVVLDDPRLGHPWLPLFTAIEEAIGFHHDYPSIDLRFLPPHTDYHFIHERRTVRVVPSGQGGTTVWICSREHSTTRPDIIRELEQQGWQPPTGRFHLGHSFSFDERPPLSEALRVGIAATAMLTPLTADDFFEVLGLRPSHPYNLGSLHPVRFGDHTYFQIPSDRATIARRTENLLSSPIDSHVYRRLTPEDRTAFIERNRKDHPDCDRWSDSTILLWESAGA